MDQQFVKNPPYYRTYSNIGRVLKLATKLKEGNVDNVFVVIV